MKHINPAAMLVAFCLLGGGQTRFATAQTVTNLYSFGTGAGDGVDPRGVLAQGSDGILYGTTVTGGSNNTGTIFRIIPGGSFSNLYSFSVSSNIPNAIGALVQGIDSNFYGTTGAGGPTSNGTVYRVSPTGNFTNLHLFSGSDGSGPYSGMMLASDGNFYGTTLLGGASNAGTVFRMTPAGDFTNLYSFAGIPDGAGPTRLVQANDGNFYGTTAGGGSNSMVTNNTTNYPFGTVFRMTPAGSLTNLHSFDGTDGSTVAGGLALGTDGNFYGTTAKGGSSNLGTVFRITPGGSFSNLYSFAGSSDGASPVYAPILGSDGNFYGTTEAGGASGKGTVYMMTPGGVLTNLHSFIGGIDGQNPIAGLVQGSDGNFYGTTSSGGASNHGTVFRLMVPAGSNANRISSISKAATDSLVSIASVAGETYQLQFRDDLVTGTWSNTAGGLVSNSPGALLTVTNFGGATQPQRYYRFKITP